MPKQTKGPAGAGPLARPAHAHTKRNRSSRARHNDVRDVTGEVLTLLGGETKAG